VSCWGRCCGGGGVVGVRGNGLWSSCEVGVMKGR